MSRRRRAAAAVAVAGARAGARCGGDAPTSATKSTKQLEVVSWWTSGSEAAALDALFAAFRAVEPGRRRRQRRGRRRRRLERDRRAGQAPAARRPARRLADVRRQVGPGLREPRRRSASVASVFDSGDLRATDAARRSCSSLMRDGQPYGVPTGAHRSNVLWFNMELLEQGRRDARRRAATPSPRSWPTSQKVKASGATPLCLGGKDRVHHRRAVREHAAELDRDERLEGHGRRRPRLAQRPGADGAEALRRHARLRRPAGEPADLGPGDEEARGRRLRLRVDERLRVRRARRRRRAGGRGLRVGALPRHRRRASSPSSTSSSPRPRRRTPRTRSRSSAASASPRRRSRSTRRRGRSRSSATSTSRR